MRILSRIFYFESFGANVFSMTISQLKQSSPMFAERQVMAHLHGIPILKQLVTFYKRKTNCIKEQMHQPNAKSASEIGPINNPEFSALFIFLVKWHANAVCVPPGACTIKKFTVVIHGFFVIRQSFCLWKAFPAKSNVCGRGQEPTLEWST